MLTSLKFRAIVALLVVSVLIVMGNSSLDPALFYPVFLVVVVFVLWLIYRWNKGNRNKK